MYEHILHQMLAHRHPSGIIPMHCMISQHPAITRSLLAHITGMTAADSAPQSFLAQTTFNVRTWVSCVLLACVMLVVFRHFTNHKVHVYDVRHDTMCRQSQDTCLQCQALYNVSPILINYKIQLYSCINRSLSTLCSDCMLRGTVTIPNTGLATIVQKTQDCTH